MKTLLHNTNLLPNASNTHGRAWVPVAAAVAVTGGSIYYFRCARRDAVDFDFRRFLCASRFSCVSGGCEICENQNQRNVWKLFCICTNDTKFITHDRLRYAWKTIYSKLARVSQAHLISNAAKIVNQKNHHLKSRVVSLFHRWASKGETNTNVDGVSWNRQV